MKNDLWINIAFTTTVGVFGLVPGMSDISHVSFAPDIPDNTLQTTKFSISRQYDRHEMVFATKFSIPGENERQKALIPPIQFFNASGTANINSFILG
ncbi:MAG: hypothetical protein ABR958_08755 [Dehalococcoidales bacterium]